MTDLFVSPPTPTSKPSGTQAATRTGNGRPSALSRLMAEQAQLPPTLGRVAAYVNAHPEEVIYQTITELATAAGVVESTVTRLCRRLGFSGFHAFKIALSGDVLTSVGETAVGETDPLSLAAHQVTQAVQGTRHLVDPAALERVAAAIADARRVDVAGQSNSGLSAQFLANKLARVGVMAIAHTDPHLAAVAAATQRTGGVVIGLTRSGSTIDTVQTLKLAAARGAFTVAVTHRASSPVTRYAREVLSTASPEAPLAGGAISSLVSQVLIIEALYLTLLPRLPGADALLRETAESVVEKKY
ncbi:MurR/RpiR family transcriptional regulator [Deinococcus hopiensis]|uniref:Transcriptional regulator, RpiR family n=1 Tax=Deinococcus hopiensis KR-140 TaxID=695939 RepID=A0A1W1UDM5_9DEIO|nr:MurR/RpiR family transcriptional regulator [Deinococcus hopiensis]SMB79195.1 transcriptional regulator, RpiR family [Deinococcus hopiensis KR-140]